MYTIQIFESTLRSEAIFVKYLSEILQGGGKEAVGIVQRIAVE